MGTRTSIGSQIHAYDLDLNRGHRPPQAMGVLKNSEAHSIDAVPALKADSRLLRLCRTRRSILTSSQ